MAQYKVPQDVEADDKLLGPFNFRQFVYLLVAGGFIALAVAFFQIFPLLALIPLPFILLLGALALPLKKDQPMETYLAALVSFYIKPRTRRWMVGQKDVSIEIIAPKKKPEEETRVRDITGEEATHRLSFLADIVDTEGYAIKGVGMGRVKDDLVAEANAMADMFETNHYESLESAISKDETEQRAKVMSGMREEIEKVGQASEVVSAPVSAPFITSTTMPNAVAVANTNAAPVATVNANNMRFSANPLNGGSQTVSNESTFPAKSEANNAMNDKSAEPPKPKPRLKAKPSMIELANNSDFSIATISKMANRIKEREEGEVFVSLH